jgi:phosphatidylglycerophosphatase A
MPRPLLYLIGTFFGTGYAPIAPATAASFLVFLIWIVGVPVPLWLQALLIVGVTAIGIPIAGRIAADVGREDPKLVVIDEVAGMLVTYFAVAAAGWVGWLAGFFWFRFFDILKPLGVRRLERLGGGGGLGIVADDLGAGVLACLATHLTVRLTGW